MHPIETIMQTAMSEIKEMVDVNTIIGEPITSTDGATIIPVSKVSFGFVSGGGEYGNAAPDKTEPAFPFAGGASSGVSLNPVAFLVVDDAGVQLLPVGGKNVLEHIIHSLPDLIYEIKQAASEHSEYGEEDMI